MSSLMDNLFKLSCTEDVLQPSMSVVMSHLHGCTCVPEWKSKQAEAAWDEWLRLWELVIHFNTTACLDLWRGLVFAGSCTCCFQILNNLVISYCSLQLFLPCDPQSRKQQRILVCTRGDSADSCVMFNHVFHPPCCGTLWEFLFVHYFHFLLNVFLSWLVFTPSRSLHWGNSGTQ